MPPVSACAPGKIILFGEHAVVYGCPAIAVPVGQVQAKVTVQAAPDLAPGQIWFSAPDIHLSRPLDSLRPDQPLRRAVELVQAELELPAWPACRVTISSTIPVASGLGSGAAVSAALIRALALFAGRPLSDDTVSALTYEVEKLHHGTPSGIDNTVIVYARPVFFIRDLPIETLHLGAPFTLVIGDTGLRSPTGAAVADVRRAWTAHPQRFEHLFESVRLIAESARDALRHADLAPLGGWMDENHALLQAMGVSCPELDRLVLAARQAGAQGAKLSGGGRGGNMIALAAPEQALPVAEALRRAGAARTWVTQVTNPPENQQAAPC